MLQEILALFHQHQGAPLSKEAISARLDIPPAVLEQMLRTLVQRGRLIEIEDGCTGCATCPLQKYCAVTPAITPKGYALAQPQSDHIRNPS